VLARDDVDQVTGFFKQFSKLSIIAARTNTLILQVLWGCVSHGSVVLSIKISGEESM